MFLPPAEKLEGASADRVGQGTKEGINLQHVRKMPFAAYSTHDIYQYWNILGQIPAKGQTLVTCAGSNRIFTLGDAL